MSPAAERAAVERHLGERVRLADYRSTITPMTPAERALLLDQAQLMLEHLYVHLPLKRALYATDPVQRVRLLRLGHAALDERAFQSALIDLFVGLRDLHTNYVLPAGYARKFAFLPFRVEEFYTPGGPGSNQERGHVVSWVSPINPDPKLNAGAVVTHWNGSPVALAVARNAEREAGSNNEARRARGIEALTLRWLGMSLPPDEDWVTLTYVYPPGGTARESRFAWEVVDADDIPGLLAGMAQAAGDGIGSAAAVAGGAAAAAPVTPVALTAPPADAGWGVDWKTLFLQRARRAVFDAPAVEVSLRMEAYRARAEIKAPSQASIQAVAAVPAATAAPAATLAALPSPSDPPPTSEDQASLFPDVFPRFGPVDTPSGRFGYVRLQSFAPESGDVDAAVAEFARILAGLPQAGLILDVRGNGGGNINFGERVLQFLTPRTVTPEPFHFAATGLTQEIADNNGWLGQWARPIGIGIATGGVFSQGFPLTEPAACNDVGQVYQGPVVLVVDAFCYSTTDIFAAGFQDHAIGHVLGTHSATGAGGANVWDHAQVLQQLSFGPAGPGSRFVPLPGGSRMRVAARRSTRLGDHAGVPLEDLGVTPDGLYHLTRDDVLYHNRDLIAFAATILKGMPAQRLDVALPAERPAPRVDATSRNVDRIDLLVDGRPVASQDVALAGATVALAPPTAVSVGTALTVNGYRRGALVVSRRVVVR